MSYRYTIVITLYEMHIYIYIYIYIYMGIKSVGKYYSIFLNIELRFRKVKGEKYYPKFQPLKS
ncbi:MAG: hypothetical protein N7Q72_05950, partial [Spiroplasma sp. Tabriz.8]|nr:hypothetical protein [Spiroplasma sp. Tabriz.8]